MKAEFWHFIQQLVSSSDIIIDRPIGSTHPRFPDSIYPVNYGYFEGTRASDNAGIDVWIGSGPKMDVNGFLATIDILKKDSEIKLVIGCSEEEIMMIQNFQNTNHMRAIFNTHEEIK
jgi:inorganic pyrophosphatase